MTHSQSIQDFSPAERIRRSFFADRLAFSGFILIILMLCAAVFAPFLANGLPLLVASGSILAVSVRYY